MECIVYTLYGDIFTHSLPITLCGESSSVLRTDVRLISQKAPTVSVQPSIVNSLTWDISDTTLTVSSIKAGSIYLGVPNKQAHLEINKLLCLTILSLYYMYELLYFNVFTPKNIPGYI